MTQKSNFLNFVINYKYPYCKNDEENIENSLHYRKFINWMSFLEGKTRLKEITLPGSLNSAVYSHNTEGNQAKSAFFSSFNQNLLDENFQKHNIISQLIAGIRFFSFICKVNHENIAIFTTNSELDGISLQEGLRFQIHEFFEKFNPKNSEIAVICFEFRCDSRFQREIMKKEVVSLLEARKYSLKRREFSLELTLNELKNMNVRYILIEKNKEIDEFGLENDDNDYFQDAEEVFSTQSFKDLMEKNEISHKNKLIVNEMFMKSFEFSPILFEKTYGKLLYDYLEETIRNFPQNKDHLPNIFAKTHVEQSPCFIKNVILLNQIKGLMNFNEYLALLFQTSERNIEKNYKNSGFSCKFSGSGAFSLGLAHLPNSTVVYEKKLVHKVFFEALLTTCFTKREEKIEIKAPKGWIFSYIEINSDFEDKTNKFKIIIKSGWLLEELITLKVKSLKSFVFQLKVEAIELSERLIHGENQIKSNKIKSNQIN